MKAMKASTWPRRKLSIRASRKKRRKIIRQWLSTMTKAINGRRARPTAKWPKWPHYAECPGMPSMCPRARALGRWPRAGSTAARHSLQAYRFVRKVSNASSGLKAGGAEPAGVVLASTLRFNSRSALR